MYVLYLAVALLGLRRGEATGLVGFAVTDLEAGASTEVVIRVPRRELAYWNEELQAWIVESGEPTFQAGPSSRDIRSTTSITIDGDPAPHRLTPESSIAEVLADPIAADTFGEIFEQVFQQAAPGFDDLLHMDVMRMIGSAPIGHFLASLGAGLLAGMAQEVFDRANEANGFGPRVVWPAGQVAELE
jgi:beta-glucosidase